MEKLNYVSIKMQNNRFSDESQICMNNMLRSWNKDNKIHICFFDKNNNELDWKSLDTKELILNGSTTFNDFEIVKAFVFIHNIMRRELLKFIQSNGNSELSSLVVIDQNYNNLLIRGIIRWNKECYQLSFNPSYLELISEYEKDIPQILNEKERRLVRTRRK